MEGPLRRLRVLEISGDVPGRACGRLLSLLGAKVERLARPGIRDWTAGAPALDASLGSRPPVEAPGDHDVVVCDLPPATARELGLDHATLAGERPGLVYVALTVFGLSGPLADVQGADVNGAAFSGVAWGVGDPRREPLVLPYLQCSHQLALHGACAAIAAARGGAGQLVDIAMAEVMAGYVATMSPLYGFYGIRYERAGHRPPGSLGRYPATILPCRDGAFCLVARSGREWKALLEAFGEPAWSREPRYRDLIRMGVEFPDEVDALVVPHLLEWTKEELFARCLATGIPSSPLRTVAELAEDENLLARGFFRPWQDVEHLPGLPFRIAAVAREPVAAW